MHEAAKLSPLPLGERDEQLQRWIESHEHSIGVLDPRTISIETLPLDDPGNQRPLKPEDKCPHGIYSPLYCSGCSTVSLEPPGWFRSEPPYERKEISGNGMRYRKDEYVGGYTGKGKRFTLQVEDGVVEANIFGGSGIQWVQISHREITNCIPQARVLGPQRYGGGDWCYDDKDFEDSELYRFGHSRSVPGVKPLTTDPVRYGFVGKSCFVPTVKFEDSFAFKIARFRNQPWERWSMKVYLDVRWTRDYFTEWSLEATPFTFKCHLFPVFRHAEHSGKNDCGCDCRKEAIVNWRDSRKAKSMRAAARLKIRDAAKLWGVSERTARRRLAEMRKAPYGVF